jgi:hypothetical protein
VAIKEQSKKRFLLSRLVTVTIGLCALSIVPIPQSSVLERAESTETECLCEEERAEARMSARRRLKRLQYHERMTFFEIGNLRQVAISASRSSAIIGHRLANGLCAPLLV